MAAATVRLETVFTVTLPTPVATTTSSTPTVASPTVHGDTLYIVTADGGVVQAVNLTNRSTVWVSPNYTSTYRWITSIAATDTVLLVFFSNAYHHALVALSALTGQQLWTQDDGFDNVLPATAFTDQRNIFSLVSPPDVYTGIQAFDLATGAAGSFQLANFLQVVGGIAFASLYQPTSGQTTITAIDTATNTTLWAVPYTDNVYDPAAGVPVANQQYVVLLNVTNDDQEVVVLHSKNGTVAHSFQAFSGLGWASLNGNLLFARVGVVYPRYVLADLTTGYITWTRSASEVGENAVRSAQGLASMDNEYLVLTITEIGGNGTGISIPNVPSEPVVRVADYGLGLVQVGNLQGFTMWDTLTGDFVQSDEQSPSAVLSSLVEWKGLGLVVSGNLVTAIKVVRT